MIKPVNLREEPAELKCHGAICLQANDAEGRKNDRLRREKKGRNLTKVDRYLQEKEGFLPNTRVNSG